MNDVEQFETILDDSTQILGSDNTNTVSDHNDPSTALLTTESTTETVEVDADMEDSKPSDISYNVAVLFILSMIVGILLFSSLSRKWHS